MELELVLVALLDRQRGGPLVEGRRGCGGDDGEALGRRSRSGRGQQPVDDGHLGAVALVADDAVVGAEQVTTAQLGALEQPVVVALHLVAGCAMRRAQVHPVVATTGEAHAGHRGFGSTGQRVGPHRGDQVLAVGAHDRVLAVVVLVGDHHPVVVLQAHLPVGGVAREERDAAAAGDEVLHTVAHAPGPVLVVTDAEQQLAAVEQRSTVGLIEVGVDRVVELDATRLGPLDEAAFLTGPSRHAVPERELLVDREGQEVADVVDDPAPHTRRLGEESCAERPSRGGQQRPGVQVASTDVVVGVPGVGRELEQRRARRRRRAAHDEPGGRCRLAHLHQVHAGPPLVVDTERHRRRPVAALLGCVVGHRLRADLDDVVAPHDLGFEPVAQDPHGDRARLVGCQTQGDLVTRQGALGPAVSDDGGHARRLGGRFAVAVSSPSRSVRRRGQFAVAASRSLHSRTRSSVSVSSGWNPGRR